MKLLTVEEGDSVEGVEGASFRARQSHTFLRLLHASKRIIRAGDWVATKITHCSYRYTRRFKVVISRRDFKTLLKKHAYSKRRQLAESFRERVTCLELGVAVYKING